jgi:hypothetical protein
MYHVDKLIKLFKEAKGNGVEYISFFDDKYRELKIKNSVKVVNHVRINMIEETDVQN